MHGLVRSQFGYYYYTGCFPKKLASLTITPSNIQDYLVNITSTLTRALISTEITHTATHLSSSGR